MTTLIFNFSYLKINFVNIVFFFCWFQHHCRNCGTVVCGPCSSKRFLLPNQSSKPLRVCLNCYDKLSRDKAQQNSTNLNYFKNCMFYFIPHLYFFVKIMNFNL